MAETALRSLVERADHLWDQRGGINEEFGELHKDVKHAGYDVETFRQIVREHRMEREVLAARLAKLNQYRAELGMLGPLGEAAAQREAAAAMNGAGEHRGPGRPRKPKPSKPFAEQPVHRRGPGRPRKTPASVDDALDRARHHLGEPGIA
jgi:uncharacterized protein (UPF0335 family)